MKKETQIPLEIKWIDAKNPEELEDAFYLRRKAFIKEQNILKQRNLTKPA